MSMTFKFGEVDAILADVQAIPSASRSAFGARLKNLHRLGFPQGVEQQGRGKAITYTVGDVALMAIAIEMSQLGLTPERAIGVIEADPYPLLMAITMGAHAALGAPADEFVKEGTPEKQQPLSMYLYFDPAALAPWKSDQGKSGEDWASATFFYGGIGIIKERLANWTTGPTTRISLINVTYLLWQMANLTPDRKAFLKEVAEWADGVITAGDFDLDEWLGIPASIARQDMLSGSRAIYPRGLTIEQIVKRQKHYKAFFRVGHFTYGNKADGGPDLIINLPGQRQLFLDAALSSKTPKHLQVIKERVAYLMTRPFKTPFTDNTKYTLMYVEQDDLSRALVEEPDFWDDAWANGVLIVSGNAMEKLFGGVVVVWADHETTAENIKEHRHGDLS